MITSWMKLGGNLGLGHDALLFSICGTGSFMCPVAQTCLGIAIKVVIYPVIDHGVKVKVLRHKADSNRLPVRPESNSRHPPGCPPPPSRRINHTPGPRREGHPIEGWPTRPETICSQDVAKEGR